jgi:hypothetical protein
MLKIYIATTWNYAMFGQLLQYIQINFANQILN